MKSDIQEITEAILRFRDEREWEKYHTPPNLAMNLSIESAELLEQFLWNREADPQRVKEELADVFYSAFLLAQTYHLDVREIVMEKLKANEMKYPADTSKGSNQKYELKR